jgi:hypothetical protein
MPELWEGDDKNTDLEENDNDFAPSVEEKLMRWA